MPPPLTLIPLGTSSAVPSQTRNHSSLAILLPSSPHTLLIDAGEGTQNQLHRFRSTTTPHVRSGRITTIFITHLHGDHVFGLCPLLCTLLNGAGGTTPGTEDPRDGAGGRRIEVFGPKGLREYIRATLEATYTHLDGGYIVHELHPTPTAPAAPEGTEGKNIPLSTDSGDWGTIWTLPHATAAAPAAPAFSMAAAPITHSVPCIGFVLTEASLPGPIPKDYAPRILAHKAALVASTGLKNPLELLRRLQDGGDTVLLPDGTILTAPERRRGRTVCVLGDTCDPGGIAALALANGCDVLVHEATNAYLPGLVEGDVEGAGEYQEVEAKAKAHGHSTPEMAGRFAARLGARVLVLNHFSSRYKDDGADGPGGAAERVMGAIRGCAEKAWEEVLQGEEGKERGTVVCARDGVPIEITLS